MLKPKKKPLCEIIGHDWGVKTLSNYRICRRSECRVMQQQKGENWIDVPPAPQQEQAAQGGQLELWGGA